MNHKSQRGFTLIELLVVIIVIFAVGSVISAILYSSFRGAGKTNTIDFVRRNGAYAITQMSRTIRYSKSLDGVSQDGTTYTTCDGRPVTAVPASTSIAKSLESGLQSFWANIISKFQDFQKKELAGSANAAGTCNPATNCTPNCSVHTDPACVVNLDINTGTLSCACFVPTAAPTSTPTPTPPICGIVSSCSGGACFSLSVPGSCSIGCVSNADCLVPTPTPILYATATPTTPPATATPTTPPATATPTTPPATATPTPIPPPTPTPIPYHYVKVTGFDGGQTTFHCDTAVIASSGASLIQSTLVNVDSCVITCGQDSIASPPTIGINLKLSSKTASNFFEKQASIPFQTSVTIRNY